MVAGSRNAYRIAGAMGLEELPVPQNKEVLTQGIGFPLRPISGVPTTDENPLFQFFVAIGQPMQWMGNWRAGVLYPEGAQVRDEQFLLIANKLTFDKAAPIPEGAASFSQPTYVPNVTDPSDTSVVNSGHTYTFTASGWIKKLRIWVPAIDPAISYRIVVLRIPVSGAAPITTTINDPVPAGVDQWTIISLLDSIIDIGDIVSITLEALNSGGTTSINGGWRYQGPTQAGAPPPQNWTVDNQRTTFRIDKTDLDSVDRSTELEGVIAETTIAVVQTDNVGKSMNYRVTSIIDQGTYMEYIVVLINETGGGPDIAAVTTLDIDVPIPLPTEYAREASVWPTGNPAWATVESFLTFDGADQADLTSGFGVDIEFQPASVSLDWDIIIAP